MRWRLALSLCIFALPAGAETLQLTGSSVALRIMEHGLICEAGPISVTLEGNELKARLSSGDIELSGHLKPDATVEMNGRKGARIYSFTGKREKDSLRGSWIEAGSGCGGTWQAKPAEQTIKAN